MSSTIKKLVKKAPNDKSSPKFQSFIYDFFTNKKNRPPAYAALVGQGNRCVKSARLNKRGKPIHEIPKLALHQTVVNTIMKILAFNKDNHNRGLLAWHSTGSGKTLTATAVIDAFWDTDRHIVYVSSVEGKAANPPNVFHANARKFFRRFKSRKFSSKDPAVSAKLVGEQFEKRGVKFMSFAQLAHFLLISKPLKSVQDPTKKEFHRNYLDNAVLIIDEVHNIFKPLPNQREECNALRSFLMDPSNLRAKNTKIVILTATPGDTPKDIVDLLNIVRDVDKPVITVPDIADQSSMTLFKESVRGLVSFFDMSGDLTKFPRVAQDLDIKSPMSSAQFDEYAKAYLKAVSDKKQNDFDKLLSKNKPAKYLEYARKYSNMLFKVQDGQAIADFSSKLADLVEKIMAFPNEKHYVYSSFYTKHGFGGQGIMAIAKVLSKELGYVELTSKDVTTDMLKDPTILPNASRYVIATSPALTRASPNAGKNLQKLVTVFNSSDNSRGQKIHVFLASQGYNEGIDLKGVRHVHIFDPLVTIASEKQTIGRAARHCSHSDLSLGDDEWTVTVHRYYADKPLTLTIANSEQLEKEISDIQVSLEKQTSALSIYKGIKGPEAKAARDNIKTQIKELKVTLSKTEKQLKKVKKVNYEQVKMVNSQIREEALDRMKVLANMYQAIYDTAVDCLIFKDFHALAGYNITCT
jgi:superfamily II DNA or RNA helicase